jgi:hypothetical protein
MAVGGGAIETITSADALVDDLIVDGVNAYFVIDVELFAWPTTGGERRLLTAEPVGFGRLAQDATHLYWRTYAGLKRIHKLGPDVVTIRSEPLSQFVVDATNVYWPTSDGIDFAPLADGPSGTAWGGLKTPGNLAIDDRCLYWSEENAIVVAAPKL